MDLEGSDAATTEEKQKPTLKDLADKIFILCDAFEEFDEELMCGETQDQLTTDKAIHRVADLLYRTTQVKNIALETNHPAILDHNECFEYKMYYMDDCSVDVKWDLDSLVEHLIRVLHNAEYAKLAQTFSALRSIHTKVDEFDDKRKKAIEDRVEMDYFAPMKFVHEQDGDEIVSKIHPDCLIPPVERIFLDFSYGVFDNEDSHAGITMQQRLDHLWLAGNFVAGLFLREQIESKQTDRQYESKSTSVTTPETNTDGADEFHSIQKNTLSKVDPPAEITESDLVITTTPAGKGGEERNRKLSQPDDLISLLVAVKEYTVSRASLKRAIDEIRLKSYRPENAPKNAPHLVSRAEVEAIWPKRN